VRGDNAWHTYRLLPCWQREQKIIRLRFDVYDAARFDWAHLRIVELDSPPPAERSDFDFNKDPKMWRLFEPLGQTQNQPVWNGPRLKQCGNGFLLGPSVHLNTASNNFVSVRMSVNHGHHATLFFATDDSYGLHSHAFELYADGRDHTYNVDMRRASAWHGEVLALGLQPSNDTNAIATLHHLSVGSAPQGSAQLRIVSFAVEEALPRTGRPVALTARLANEGSEEAASIRARLTPPPGLQLITSAERTVDRLAFGEATNLTWEVQSPDGKQSATQAQCG
jgi:hypothetical protein